MIDASSYFLRARADPVETAKSKFLPALEEARFYVPPACEYGESVVEWDTDAQSGLR